MDKVYALGVLLVVLGGVALAMQAGINAALARATDSRAFAAVVSFALGLAVCAAYLAVDAAGLRHGLPTPASLRGATQCDCGCLHGRFSGRLPRCVHQSCRRRRCSPRLSRIISPAQPLQLRRGGLGWAACWARFTSSW